MAVRIEVAYKEGIRDVPGEKLKNRIKAELGIGVSVHVADVYTIDADLPAAAVETLEDGCVHRPRAPGRLQPDPRAL